MRAELGTLKVFAVAVLFSFTAHVKGSASPKGGADPSRSYVLRPHSYNLARSAQARVSQDARHVGGNVPLPIRFQESGRRGLLVRAWVNGVGPYTFVLDTGAGANILSRRVASEARVEVDANGRGIRFGGLSGTSTVAGRRAHVRDFALGSRDNRLPSQGFTVIADALPSDIDGVLDPTEAFWPLGYTIDMPGETLHAFDPRVTPLRADDSTPDGAVVRWLTEQGSRRPFVSLTGGRRALVDTGSGFGLALNAEAAKALGVVDVGGRNWEGMRDLAGGQIPSRRVRPATVHIGPLALRNVPTDYLPTAHASAPILLGRDALRPFQITFDPINRLIRFRPT